MALERALALRFEDTQMARLLNSSTMPVHFLGGTCIPCSKTVYLFLPASGDVFLVWMVEVYLALMRTTLHERPNAGRYFLPAQTCRQVESSGFACTVQGAGAGDVDLQNAPALTACSLRLGSKWGMGI